MRTNSDYNDFYIVSKADVAEHIGNAARFIRMVEEYLDSLSQTE